MLSVRDCSDILVPTITFVLVLVLVLVRFDFSCYSVIVMHEFSKYPWITGMSIIDTFVLLVGLEVRTFEF